MFSDKTCSAIAAFKQKQTIVPTTPIVLSTIIEARKSSSKSTPTVEFPEAAMLNIGGPPS